MLAIATTTSTSWTSKPRKPRKSKEPKEEQYKSRDLISSGFITFLDEEPKQASKSEEIIISPEPTKAIQENPPSPETQQEKTKPFFHSEADLPKIRAQNMRNYSDLSQYPRASEQTLTEYFPELDQIIHAESAKVGPTPAREKQLGNIRRFYGYIRDDISRILIHRFIRPMPQHNKEYYYRLALEFKLIKQKTFTKVFLQVLDILGLLDPAKTPHVIRGSAGSCLVCYLLGITDSDPIAEGISLARFMHAARDDLPDIDMDFPHNQRDEIYLRIFATWPQRVARISNHVAYGAKTALKKIMKDHGVKGRIPKDFALEDYIPDSAEQEEIRAAAEELEGQFKHFSLHCGGIVIFDQAIPAEYYLQDIHANKSHATKNKPSTTSITSATTEDKEKEVLGIQINLNKDQVDDYAFIKIDILSNRGLSQLWDISNQPLLDYPSNDPRTLKALCEGRNIGLTYAESRAIGKAFQHIQPRGIHDIAMALAIIRPAASSNGQKMDFLRDLTHIRAGQPIDRDYIIYDDDAIQTINRILDCGESQADIYRKAFAKRKFKLMKEFHDRLDIRRQDWTIAKRDAICDQLACLQEYSFCKSHALSYARLVYALAYQKTHNPVRFWLASLNNCNSSYRSWVHFREAVAAGVKLTAGRAPWRISATDPTRIEPTHPDQPAISTGTSTSTAEHQISYYFRYGFWPAPEFLPGMFHNIYYADPLVNVASKKAPTSIMVNMCEFRGLIATHRICKTDRHAKKYSQPSQPTAKKDKWITFATLGIDNGRYIDIVLYGAIRLGKCHVIEGEGYWMNNAPENSLSPWIKVKKWRSRYLAPTYPDSETCTD
jgi:hypothetical protein